MVNNHLGQKSISKEVIILAKTNEMSNWLDWQMALKWENTIQEET